MLEKAFCTYFKNSVIIELNEAVEELSNSKFIDYMTRFETLLTEALTSNKTKIILLKEECNDRANYRQNLPTVNNLSSNNCA